MHERHEAGASQMWQIEIVCHVACVKKMLRSLKFEWEEVAFNDV